jgi:hypothetical protein
MLSLVSILLASLSAWFRSRLSVQMELLALRYQVAVYKQSVSRLKLRPTDRFLWVWLSCLWPGWQEALACVQPRTVSAWQKKRCRNYWRRLSQSGKPGRPASVKEVRKLIQAMWQPHPTWGSPRIVGELQKLGSDVAKSTVETYRPKVRKLLDHVIVLNKRHLVRLLTDYLSYYHRFRTHLALDMDRPVPRAVEPPEWGPARAVPAVGGLHHHYEYERIAA